MKPIEEMNMLEIGIELGYPMCCVMHFVDHMARCRKNNKITPVYADEDVRGKPWFGTGFIPCPICRKDGADNEFGKLKREIKRLRNPSLPPFPDFE